MSRQLSWSQHAARIVAELFTLKDPYPDIVTPRVISEHKDQTGWTVRTVAANNYKEVNQFGGNVAGGMVVHTRTGIKTWKVHVEETK